MTKKLLGDIELNRIYQRDCIEGMRMIPSGSVDLTVTSPPYDNLRTYKGFTFDFEGVASELFRVTKQGGVVVWVVGDATIAGSETLSSFKQALYFREIGFNVHDTMIYEKSTSPFPQSNRYNSQFEYMFVFSKGAPYTFNAIKDVAESNLHRRGKRDGSYRNADGNMVSAVYESRKPEKTRSNIWRYAVGMNCTTKDRFAFGHPAMFPESLAQDHILSWSNEGDIILDPFMGAGTTAKMALINRRNFTGFEISSEYIEIANKRLDSISTEVTAI